MWGEAGSPQRRQGRGQGEAGPGLRWVILPDQRRRLLPHQGRWTRGRLWLRLDRLGTILLLEEAEQPRDGLGPHLLLHGVSLQQPRPLVVGGEQEFIGGQFEGRGLPLAGHGAWW